MADRIIHRDGIYSRVEYVPPKAPDQILFNWFRSVITEPEIMEKDLLTSQDCRYVQSILYFLARTSHAKTIVEIGMAEGTTTYPLLKAVSEMEGGILHSIDPSSAATGLTGDMVHRNGLTSHWHCHNMKSDDFFEGEGKNLTIDFAFIDGDHSYDGVYNDAVNVIERLIPGGIVVFHDFDGGLNEQTYNYPKGRSPEACPQAVIRVLGELFLKYNVEGMPLAFGAGGLGRTDTWTEGGSYIVRKCLPGEITLRTKAEPFLNPRTEEKN